MAIEINEIRLTAYALGELYGAERAAVEAHLADNSEAQFFVNEMRETARLVTNELAHEPVVGLLAVHHAAIERHLEEIERFNQPLRLHHTPVLPLRARVRQWVGVGLATAAAVVIVGGAIVVLSPQLWPTHGGGGGDVAQDTGHGPVYLPSHDVKVSPQQPPQVAQNTGNNSVSAKSQTPDPFPPPAPVATDDRHAQPAPAADGSNPAADATARDAVAQGSTDNDAGALPFGPPRTEALPGKRPRASDALAASTPARGGAERSGDAASVRFARSDGNRGVENYANLIENPFVNVSERPLSSFAVNVDSTSYLTVRRAINAGRGVSPADVRIEEFLNAFAYHYAPPEGNDAFAADIKVADCPWDSQHRLVRVGLRAKDAPPEKRPQAGNLVFLVDVSGGMSAENRLPMLKQAMRSLVETMTPADRVSVVTYGGASGEGVVTLAPTSGREKQKVQDAINALAASGAPAPGDGAIDLAYKTAAQSQPLVRGVHRVVLCTGDGFVAGLGDQLRVLQLVQDKAKANVGLSVIAVGATRPNDASMRTLARRANGTYAAADNLDETTRALASAAAPAAPVVARDVRVQVEFNPLVAGAYRLIGYENRSTSAADDDDDATVGDNVTAGHVVTALYEVVPAGKPVPGAEVFALKYSKRQGFQAPAEGKSDELLTLKLHYLLPDDGKPARPEDRNGKLMEFPVKDGGDKYASAGDDFKFAAAVAEYALVMRGSEHRGQADLERVARLASESAGNDPAKGEFAALVRKTISQGR